MSTNPIQAVSGSNVAAARRTDWKMFLFGSAATIAVAYFGMFHPAQEHVAELQRQCDQLARAVGELNSAGVSAVGTNKLLAVLQQQGRQLGQAEAVVERFQELSQRMSGQMVRAEQASQALDRVEQLHQGIAACGKTLSEAASVLHEMADLSMTIDASRELAREARSSLAVLDELHRDLNAGLAAVDDASPMLDHVRDLCGRLADSESLVQRAAEVNARSSQLEKQLIDRQASLPTAEKAFQQISSLCDRLVSEAGDTELSEQRLTRLLKLKNGLLHRTLDLEDAQATLDRLVDLREGLIGATGTVSEVQHMIVDVMLLQPAVDRAVQALQPVIDFTRTARQLDLGAILSQSGTSKPAKDAPRAPALDVARAIREQAQ